jgi:hypothetical protein
VLSTLALLGASPADRIGQLDPFAGIIYAVDQECRAHHYQAVAWQLRNNQRSYPSGRITNAFIDS